MSRKPIGFTAPPKGGSGRGPMIGRAVILTSKPARVRKKSTIGYYAAGADMGSSKSGAIGRKVVRAAAKAAVTVEIPVAELDALRARIEDLEDARDLMAAAKTAKVEDYLPAELMNRIIAGEHPVRVWREHRGLSARKLAEKAEIPVSYLSEIENRKKPGSIDAYRALAEALELTIDDLAP
jgi:hypothetical protein